MGSLYASLDDLLLTMGQTTSDTRFHANALVRLEEASRDIDRAIGRSYEQVTEARIVHGDGSGVLHVHGGIVSLDTVEVRTATGGAWETLQVEDTGWYLEGAVGTGIIGTNEPAFHIQLVDTATHTTFPEVRQGVRLTGTFGWPDIPINVQTATVAWARQRLALDPSLPGGIISGPEDIGGAVSLDRWPRVVRDLIDSERHRFWCHL